MARPRKPQWINPGQGRTKGYWRTKINGKFHYNREIGRWDAPLVGSGKTGIPRTAWDWLHGLEAADKAVKVEGSDPTCFWLVNAYLDWADTEVKEGRYTRDQWLGQRTRLGVFLAFPGVSNAPAGSLNIDLLGDFLADLGGRYAPSYVAGIGRSIRTVWRWAARPVAKRVPPRLIASNPLEGYRFPKAPKSTREYVDGATVRRFIRWGWARARARVGVIRRFDRLFLLALWFQRLTGARPGEAFCLRWDAWDREAGKIKLVEHKSAHLGKDRVIWVTPPVERLLRTIERLERRHPEYVFTHRRCPGSIERGNLDPVAGEPWPSGSSASQNVTKLRAAAIAAGVKGVEKVGPRKLIAYANRHGFASEAVSRGFSIEHTAEMLGNTPAVTEATYAHLIEAAAKARAEAMASKGRKKGAG